MSANFPALFLCSLAGNQLCGLNQYGVGTYTAVGINALCEGLKGSTITLLNLDRNGLTGKDGEDMSAVLKLAEVLPQTKLQTLRCLPAKCRRSLLAPLERRPVRTPPSDLRVQKGCRPKKGAAK